MIGCRILLIHDFHEYIVRQVGLGMKDHPILYRENSRHASQCVQLKSSCFGPEDMRRERMRKIKRVEEINMKVKYLLDESDLPKFWYNIAADLPSPLPAVLHPGTLQPIGPDDLAPLFPMTLIMQEVSTEREIEIPRPVRDIYRQWRPSPLYRA